MVQFRSAAMPPLVEEHVRAPLPVTRDRLYGDTFVTRGTSGNKSQQNEVQAFRDFK